MSGFHIGGSTRERRKGSAPSVNTMALKADIDPAPKAWPFASALAGLVILLFILLQFILPVTHVRHPADPHRNWIPVSQLNKNKKLDSGIVWPNLDEDGGNMVVVMTKETDIRPVFVAINSTLSNTREPEKLQFWVILLSSTTSSQSMKLRMLFSNLNLHVDSDESLTKKMRPLLVSEITSEENRNLVDLIPFYFPKMFPQFERFVYLNADAVLQGDIGELIKINMEGYPIAAIEDCGQTFNSYFAIGLLEASRLSLEGEKPLMPAEPYDPSTCLFDRGVLIIDGKSWKEKKVVEAAHWWIGMQRKSGESLYSNGRLELPMHLAIYNNYKKVDAPWSIREPLTLEKVSGAKLIHFDKSHKPWHQTKAPNFENDVTSLWWKYIAPSTNTLFNS